MDLSITDRSHGSSFVPEACTLPSAEQPLRVAEFDALFASAVRAVVRSSPTTLRLILDGAPATEAAARELVTRETECCSFFTFTFQPVGAGEPDGLALTVAVPAAHIDVLDGVQRLAETAGRERDPA